MKSYRSYFDRVEFSESQHQALLRRVEERTAPPRRESRLFVRTAAAVACLALLCLAGWGVYTGLRTAPGGDPVSPPILAQPSPTPGGAITGEDPYVLTPAGDWGSDWKEGGLTAEALRKVLPGFQALRFGVLPGEAAVDLALPEGAFEERLTREQMLYLLGGESAQDAPWQLAWTGFDVTGAVLYDGEGRVWRITLQGVGREDVAPWGGSFTVTLKPGALPEDCAIAPESEETVINGVTVYTSSYGGAYEAAFETGGVGFRIWAGGGEAAVAEGLVLTAANYFVSPIGPVYLDRLVPEEIPVWRSQTLTLEEAREDPGFGAYLPAWVPEGFAFEEARREVGQDEDCLSALWCGYYTEIRVRVSRPDGEVTVTERTDPARYDVRLYDFPYAETVPEEYWQEFDHPVFRAADLSAELLAARLKQVPGDSRDAASYRGNFSLLYEDGTVVEYNLKGVSPQDAARVLGVDE